MQRARSERNDARRRSTRSPRRLNFSKPQLAAAEEKLRAASTRADDAERDAREMKSARSASTKSASISRTRRARRSVACRRRNAPTRPSSNRARLHAELVAARASKDALDPKLSKLGNELADAHVEARELKHEKERMQNEISSPEALRRLARGCQGVGAIQTLETATMEKAALDERFNAETNARREVQDEFESHEEAEHVLGESVRRG